MNLHPRLSDVHAAFADFLAFTNLTRVAIVFSAESSERSQRALALQVPL